MSKHRIFIAVDLSAEAREVVASHIADIRQLRAADRVRWERVEKLHVTLKFLGSTTPEQLGLVTSRVTEIAADMGPFRLSLGEAGVFPSKSRPRILWIGLTDHSESLSRIAERLNVDLEPLGFEPEARRFHPHITIARLREVRGLDEVVRHHLNAHIEPVEFEVRELVVYESKLHPTGSVYSVISKAELPSPG